MDENRWYEKNVVFLPWNMCFHNYWLRLIWHKTFYEI